MLLLGSMNSPSPIEDSNWKDGMLALGFLVKGKGESGKVTQNGLLSGR